MTTSMSSRHRAMLGALLIFCIGSLLTLSLRPIQDNDSRWVLSRRPGFDTSDSSSSSQQPQQQSSDDDRFGTGARSPNLDNNKDLDASDLAALTVEALRQLTKGTVLDTTEDLLDPTRHIRPWSSSSLAASGASSGSGSSSSELDLTPDMLNHQGEDEADLVNAEDDEEEDEEDDETENTDESTMNDPAAVIPGSKDKVDQDPSLDLDPIIDEEDQEQADEEVLSGINEPEPLSADGSPIVPPQQETQPDPARHPLNGLPPSTPSPANPLHDTSLADFDVTGALNPSDSYLVFVPSGETIEAQFFSLQTALWIAKHSNRTLIIPPPMMSSPSQSHLYPYFLGPNSRKRQRWSTLYDLRPISNTQPTILIDKTRPVLMTPFTDAMAREEENPTTLKQAVPFEFLTTNVNGQDVTPAGSTIPARIKCHGPPTAGSWKALDFAGRHFLNRYNLVADFDILVDPYWSLLPESIQKHWKSRLQTVGTSDSSRTALPNHDHHRQLICISGAGLVGANDPAMEETIWQEIGLQIPYSRQTRTQARQNVLQVLRALEGGERRNGYIGVHIDKLPSNEFCRQHGSSQGHDNAAEGASYFKGDSADGIAAVAGGSAMIPPQCLWTVDLIAKRIATLQKTEGVNPRPVLVTTTETDPELLTKMDQQPGWLRIGTEDDWEGLFDEGEDLGGYGIMVTRASIMTNSAIFVGSRSSALAVHVAFRIKNEGRLRQVPPRWELY